MTSENTTLESTTPEKKGLSLNRPLVYAGLVALAFLVGVAVGFVVLGRWLWPPVVPEATPSAPIGSPQPTEVGLVTTPSLTGTAGALATPCGTHPPGWAPYTVEPGDTLSELAALVGVTQENVMRANCLASPELQSGQVLYLPPLPTPTPCPPLPPGWEPYSVEPGDTLSRLAALAGVSLEEAMDANCLASPELQAGQVLYLPPLPTPTPTPCLVSPPPGWEPYSIRVGDTLFSLAVTRGTTTDEVMRVNCLTSLAIAPGQVLYLPPLPISFAPPVLPSVQPAPGEATPGESQPSPGEAVSSAFSPKANTRGFPPLNLEPGGPGSPSFVPCQGLNKLEFDTTRNVIELGQRRYLYVCVGNPVSAQLSRPDGLTQTVELLTAIPNPDLQMGKAQAVLDWPALPFEPTGWYTMIVTDSAGVSEEHRFLVTASTEKRILIVPPAGPPGMVFQVYYVNFDLDTEPEFVFYGEDVPTEGGEHHMTYRDDWKVRITQPLGDGKGWGQAPLVSFETNRLGAYSITYNEKEIANLFWLR